MWCHLPAITALAGGEEGTALQRGDLGPTLAMCVRTEGPANFPSHS